MITKPNSSFAAPSAMRQQAAGPVSAAAAAAAAGVGGWVGDLRSERLWCSDECYRLFGVEPGVSQPSLRNFLQRVHPQDRKRVRTAILRGLTEPGVYEIEYRVVLPGGSIGNFVNQGFTFCDDAGLPVSVGGTTRQRGMQLVVDAATRREADFLRVLLANSTDGVAVFDAEAGLQRWNALFVSRLELPHEFVHVGARCEMLLLPLAVRGDFGAGEPVAMVRDLLQRLANSQRVAMHRGAPGAVLELRGNKLDEGGFVLFCAENTANPQQQERLLLADTVMGNSPAGIVVVDAAHFVRSINPAFAAMTDFEPVEIVGRSITVLADSDQFAEMNRGIASLEHRAAWDGEIPLRKRNGEIFNARIRAARVVATDGAAATHHVWMFSDISESKRAAAQMDHLAHHDPLTGLPNRLALQMRLDQSLPEARRRGWNVALMFIDLDRFKIINDTLGHSVGDELLREVAGRLQRAVRETDMVARLGGDEFVILLPDIVNVSDVANVASKVLAAFANPVLVDAIELHTSPSIGISLFPDDGTDGDTLLKNCDTAMYHAKAAGRNNYQFYAAEMNLAATQRLDLESKLRHALARNEFALAFQPQVKADSQIPVGVEALVRWHHPRDGVISPARFIPIAEETGLIVPLGEWVLRTACQQMKNWLDAGLPPIKMAVNVSARQLKRRDFLETVAGVLIETELPPELLELELTESVAMENPEESIRLLQSIRQMGVSIAIDDFGTGYSSLAYLKRLPIDYLKIDRSFVADIEHDLNDRAIAFGTIALAHSLGLEVIAEGVETADQLELLRTNGCDEIQGYYFSQPLEPKAAFAYLQQQFQISLAAPENE